MPDVLTLAELPPEVLAELREAATKNGTTVEAEATARLVKVVMRDKLPPLGEPIPSLEMIARARDQGIEPILATEVTARPRGDSLIDTLASVAGALRGKPSYQDQVNQQVMAVNQWLIDLGAREGLLVLQFQSTLSEQGGRRRKQFAQPDGSHITPAGYDALTSYVTPILEEFLVAR